MSIKTFLEPAVDDMCWLQEPLTYDENVKLNVGYVEDLSKQNVLSGQCMFRAIHFICVCFGIGSVQTMV